MEEAWKHLDPGSVSATESDTSFIDGCKAFLDRHFPEYPDLSWHVAYACANGMRRAEYIPEGAFYLQVEPSINPRAAADRFSDKNTYDLLFAETRLPTTVGRVMNGKTLLGDYTTVTAAALLDGLQRAERDLIVKPSVGSMGGQAVRVTSREELAQWTVEGFTRMITGEDNLVFQELVKQHGCLAKLHPPSLNTLRISTLALPDRVVIASAVLRMGVNGARVDNQSAGGIASGIDDAGRLRRFAYDKKFVRYRAHPSTGYRFEGIEIPGYAEACDLAIALHGRLPLFGMISWDIAVNSEKAPLLIEANLAFQEINFHQLNNGPLFGPYTQEMLRLV